MSTEAKLDKVITLIREYFEAKNNRHLTAFKKKLSPILYSELENFFTNSTVNKFFQSNSENLKDSLIIDYDGRSYVRMMKLFAPSKYTEVDYHRCKYGLELNQVMNKESFHLRYYIPKETIGTIGKKISRIVIMFNGMNEIVKFDLYDMLGEFFANNNIAAVLLPTPLHLNRRVSEQFKPNSTESAFIPSKFANDNGNHELFYLNYIKSYLELNRLIQKIRGSLKNEDRDEDFEFYKNYFDQKNVKNYIIRIFVRRVKSARIFFNGLQSNITRGKCY